MIQDIKEQIDTSLGPKDSREYKRWERDKYKLQMAVGVFSLLQSGFKDYKTSLTKQGKKKIWTLESIQAETEKEVSLVLGNGKKIVFDVHSNHYFILEEDKRGLLSQDLKVIFEPSFDEIKMFQGYSYMGIWENERLFLVTKWGKQWLIDSQGSILVDIKYDNVEQFYKKESSNTIRLKNDEKEGIVIIHRKNKNFSVYYIKEPFSEKIYGTDQEGYLFWKKDNHQMASRYDDNSKEFAISDSEWQAMIDWKINKICTYLDNKRQLKSFGTRRGDILATEELGWEKEVEYIDERNGPFIKYKKEGKFGISKRWMKEIVPPEYDEILSCGTGSSLEFIHRKGKVWGTTEFTGRELISSSKLTDEIKNIPYISFAHYIRQENLRKLRVPISWPNKDNYTTEKYNTETAYNNIQTLVETRDGNEIHCPLVIVNRDGKYGVANRWLKEIVPAQYDKITYKGLQETSPDIRAFSVYTGETEASLIEIGMLDGKKYVIIDEINRKSIDDCLPF